MAYLVSTFCRFLKNAIGSLAVVSAFAVWTPAVAQDAPPVLTITTGGSSGTYFRFAREIADMLPNDVQLEIVPSSGSVQNLRRLIGYEGQSEQKYYQLAMVQADVLEQLRTRAKGDEVLESIVDRIKVVMPLYSEEIHAFAKSENEIRGLDDLISRGFIVNAGDEKSGTNLTARWLYEQSGNEDLTVDWVNASDDEGLPSLENGVYDVLFYVAGAPSKLGRSVAAEQGITLVPIELPELYDLPNSPYRPARITRDQYPWLNHDVETMAVNALLVAFDYDENNPYCTQIEKLTRAVVDGLPIMLEQNIGHPKWREVDLVAARNRTDLYTCAARALNAR